MTAESLLEILRSLRSDGLLDADSNRSMRRRKLPRVGIRDRLTILPVGNDCDERVTASPTNIRIRDIGPRGIGFVSDVAMSVGEKFLVLLHRERGGIVHILAEVKRARNVGGTYDIGGTFHLDTTREEINAYLRSVKRAA
ncbi:MAG: hypothetical protein AAGI46_04020 [Planctomycetota bacterium]